MLLILTNSRDATADYLAPILDEEGIVHRRLDTDTLLRKASFHFDGVTPVVLFDGVPHLPEQVTAVWYRRPERLKDPGAGDSPETKFVLDEWAEALEGFFAHVPKARWVNHPASNVAASHKVEQLTAARSLGLLLPETLVTQDAGELRRFHARHGGEVVVKPLGRGYVERGGEGDSLIYTNEVSADHLEDLGDLAGCPTLFQRRIRKRSDVRVTVVDRDAHAVELTALGPDGRQRCDIRRNNMEDVSYRVIDMPPDVRSGVERLMGLYGLRFAAIDFVVDTEGRWYFLEVNPNGQWAWMDLAGVTNIAASFVRSFRL